MFILTGLGDNITKWLVRYLRTCYDETMLFVKRKIK